MPKLRQRLTQLFKKAPRVGMVLIVRDEARFLDIHLRYHHWLGIERAYCYEHRCVDESGEIAARFPWVQRIILEGRCPIREAYISELHRHCMNDALTRARQERLDWLLIIDADEFVVPGERPSKNGLPQALRVLPDAVIEARLRTREVVPCAGYSDANWHQNPFFAVSDRTPHPLGNGAEWIGHLGHSQGQRIVRTSAPVQAYDSHRWTAALREASEGMPGYRPLPTAEIGWHAHYYLASPEHWLEKFTRHNDFPQHWPAPAKDGGATESVPLEQPVAVWRQCVAQLSGQRGAALAWAKTQLFRPAPTLHQLAQEAHLEVDPSLPKALEAATHLPAASKNRSPQPPIHLAITDLAPPPTIRPAQMDLCQGNILIHEILLKGFYDWESADNLPFRWSQPEASISGDLPAGSYQVSLQLKKSYSHHNSVSEIQLQFENEPIRLRRHVADSRLSGSFHHQGGHITLRLNVPTLPAPGDPRELGLPLHALSLKRT